MGLQRRGIGMDLLLISLGKQIPHTHTVTEGIHMAYLSLK